MTNSHINSIGVLFIELNCTKPVHYEPKFHQPQIKLEIFCEERKTKKRFSNRLFSFFLSTFLSSSNHNILSIASVCLAVDKRIAKTLAQHKLSAEKLKTCSFTSRYCLLDYSLTFLLFQFKYSPPQLLLLQYTCCSFSFHSMYVDDKF